MIDPDGHVLYDQRFPTARTRRFPNPPCLAAAAAAGGFPLLLDVLPRGRSSGSGSGAGGASSAGFDRL